MPPHRGEQIFRRTIGEEDGKVFKMFRVVYVLEVVSASLLECCTVNDPSLANMAW